MNSDTTGRQASPEGEAESEPGRDDTEGFDAKDGKSRSSKPESTKHAYAASENPNAAKQTTVMWIDFTHDSQKDESNRMRNWNYYT